MENVKLINDNSINLFLSNLHYGTNLVSYQNGTSRDKLLSNIKILNEVIGSQAIEELPAIANDLIDGEYVERQLEGTFNILYRLRNEKVPELTQSDYNFKKEAERAFDNKIKVHFQLNEKLHKMAGRIAFGLGIKFGKDSFGCFFNAENKNASVYMQIKNAYEGGAEKIEFETAKHNSATIRCYASNLSSDTGKKIRCTSRAGIISVHFKEPTPAEAFRRELVSLFDHYEYLTGKKVALDIMKDVLAEKNVFYVGMLPHPYNKFEAHTPVKIDDLPGGKINLSNEPEFIDEESAFDETPEETERIRLRDEEIQKQWDAKNGIGIDLYTNDFLQDVAEEFGQDDEF